MYKYKGYSIVKSPQGKGWTTLQNNKIKGRTVAEVKKVINSGRSEKTSNELLINFWDFCLTYFYKDAPKEVLKSLKKSALHPPKNEDDISLFVFSLLGKTLPNDLLTPALIDPGEQTEEVIAKRVVVASILTHPRWHQLLLLKELIERCKKLQEKDNEDYKHWLFCVFEFVNYLASRILFDVSEMLKEEGVEYNFKSVIQDDDELFDVATESYRDCLRNWKNEHATPPFTKHDVWMALIQPPLKETDALLSPSLLITERAIRIIENYGVSKRDAMIVIAIMEQLGEVINLKDECQVAD